MNIAALASGRETQIESAGAIKGVAIGLVTQNNDPDQLCRVKVRFPWHDQPTESYWARLAAPMAGKDRGWVSIPEVGDEVLVAFERGDVRFPCVLGALWNGQDQPPAANTDGRNDKRLFKSRKGHLLSFDDNAARGKLELSLNDGKKLAIDDDGIQIDDGAGNKVAINSKAGEVSIQAATRLTLKAPQVSIESDATMEVRAGATLTLRGTLVQIN